MLSGRMEVEHFGTLEEAYLFKARKEAEGYHAFVLDQHLPYGMPFPSVRVTFYPKVEEDRKTVGLPEGRVARSLEFVFIVILMTSLVVWLFILANLLFEFPVGFLLVTANAFGILALPLILYTWISILCDEGAKPKAFRTLVSLLLLLPLVFAYTLGGRVGDPDLKYNQPEKFIKIPED